MATLLAISTGRVERLGVIGAADRLDEAWTTGIFKAAVARPVRVFPDHLDGDQQADRANHGGPDKAICVYAADHYAQWRQTLDQPTLEYGAFGENFTVQGLTEGEVCVGDVWAIGDVQVQVSQPRQPCWKLARKWRSPDLVDRVLANGHTGWYLRVMRTGLVHPGAAIDLVARSHPAWTIEAANAVMHHRRDDFEAARALASVEPLSGAWKQALATRVRAAHRPRGSAL